LQTTSAMYNCCCSVEGCARLSTVGAALGVSALASLRRLDMSWVGAELEHEGPHEDGDQAALRVHWSTRIAMLRVLTTTAPAQQRLSTCSSSAQAPAVQGQYFQWSASVLLLQAANNGFGFAGWAEALAACLTNLEDLRAGGTNATDFDLLALRPLTKLTSLDLSDSPEVSPGPEAAAHGTDDNTGALCKP
jgi:hypothetical protein